MRWGEEEVFFGNSQFLNAHAYRHISFRHCVCKNYWEKVSWRICTRGAIRSNAKICQILPFNGKTKLAKEEIYFVNLDISAIKSSKITKARKKIVGGGVRYRYFREVKNLWPWSNLPPKANTLSKQEEGCSQEWNVPKIIHIALCPGVLNEAERNFDIAFSQEKCLKGAPVALYRREQGWHFSH